MPCFSAVNCSERSEKGVRLFLLPQGKRNEERAKQWIINLKRANLPKTTYVCEVGSPSKQPRTKQPRQNSPDKTAPVKTARDKTAPDKTAPDKTIKYCINFILQKHFTEDQFENNRIDNKRPIRWNAIATIFSHKKIAKQRKPPVDR
ncbi:hypothetical protein MML48_1g13562 [Holotrichia oblita]|uniref:Uncharacterized protein n=1 Tax=Holotrichia oblita TaxID=644536 RepID=A0ACB9TY44_HOLOL|nr:hypothetical protein MML48_1g13562 [Holotrichia oblita]